MAGIEQSQRSGVGRRALPDGYSLAALQDGLAKEGAKVVIGLGTRGLEVAQELQKTYGVVVGAVVADPTHYKVTGIVHIPDPELLFQQIKALTPQIKEITTVYMRDHNQWLIERAQVSARRLGYVLDAYAAKDPREIAALYHDILTGMSRSEAIWLIADPGMDERVMLPFILEEAWGRNLTVFSSNPIHVKRGALFALYPDNAAIGRRLGEIAKAQLAGSMPAPVLEPTRDVKLAVNLRTAEHLGLAFTAQARQRFDLVFPAP
ncbi:MAG: ABC transporter substrate binding protein [Gammaproteobacteria bacterium]